MRKQDKKIIAMGKVLLDKETEKEKIVNGKSSGG
jgi:hypothetical protein